MHQCLRVAEIVWRIFEDVNDLCDGDSLYRRKTFYALARTCRFFRDPAIACLWESIPSLVPLMKCVDRDGWKVESEGDGSELQLTRDLSPSDIVIIKKYASLVRDFGLNLQRWYFANHVRFYESRPRVSVAVDVWDGLNRALKGTILFPHVRSIYVRDEQMMRFHTLFSLHGLVSLTLYRDPLKSTDHDQASLLNQFLARGSDPTSVSLHPSDSGLEAPLQALSNSQNLSRFRSVDMSLEMLQVLSHHCSSSLRFLRFDSFHYNQNLKPLANTEFPLLEEASIGFESIYDATRFFKYFPPSACLQSLTVLVSPDRISDDEDWLRLFRRITRCQDDLKELVIEENMHLIRGDIRGAALSNAFINLIASNFTTLTRLRILHVGAYWIYDQDLKVLTEALPLLEDFCLINSAFGRQRNFKNTIASYAFFAENCHHLKSLGLGFYLWLGKVPRRPKLSTPVSKLTRLDVSGAIIEDPRRVARYLFRVFPDIQILLCDEKDIGEVDDYKMKPWSKVYRLLEQARRNGSSAARKLSTESSDDETA